MKQKIGAKESFTVAEAAYKMGMSVKRVENLIRKGLLGFKAGINGPVISATDMNNYYLGWKPKSEPEYKPEKRKRKMPKYYVKAKTRR